MYQVNTPVYAYEDPWALSFDERANRLFRPASAKVVYLYANVDNSTFRYRVYNMMQALKGEKDVVASYFTFDEIVWLGNHLHLVDRLVVCRCRYTHLVNELILKARQRGIPVIFDVDDLIFDSDYCHLVVESLNQDLNHPDVWDHWFAVASRTGATLKLCDRAITTNKFLAEKIAEFHPVSVSTVPNFMNTEQLGYSEKLFTEKKSSAFDRNQFVTIGYFSGSPTHEKDFAIVEPVLIDLMKIYPHLSLMLVGFLNNRPSLREFSNRVTYYGFHDFINLQRLISLVEINIAPLQNNVFTNCKSELKYFEAAIVGTVTIASPTYTFRNSITHGKTGYIANQQDWHGVLCDVIENIDKQSKVIEAGHKYVASTYTGPAQLEAIKSALAI